MPIRHISSLQRAVISEVLINFENDETLSLFASEL
jgi:hypothetical protein